ncbi:efflux RND transporter permease subunit [Terribacillus saccharophilus]|uniref:Swarming motility protein SwrC n=1 Tax=Terribacillus saccharophilus TaxID=361277 RepID=A0ABX4GZP2_9BACI|nr:efflux RND transporter permease subunit [Terribacillus saccharophilus]PAD36213.1 Swarming motility protein SwrC [Terribacillus saccharophilus]PAD96765.1 Swarming motility protein SwrC [Terribacillus saccharophilus]PAE00341.1 Swarming motility protein SwrC [Terribacillus saccharophilus]
MRKFINFSLKNKVAVWLLTIMVVVTGIYAGTNMKLETLPDISVPVLTVTTTYPGAPPEEVLESVTEPIEQAVQSLDGVENISSTSLQNASTIQLEYAYSKNLDDAETEVKEALENVQLPEDAEEPTAAQINLNSFPVITLSASNSNQTIEELTQTVESDLQPALEGIEGASSVGISGQQVQEVQITYDEDALTENGLTQDTVGQVIQNSSDSYPLGLYQFGNSEKNVAVDGNIVTLDDLRNLEIPVTGSASAQQAQGGQGAAAGQSGQADAAAQAAQAAQAPTELPTVQLQDVAEVEVVGEVESISRTNGEDSIGIDITKDPNANTVEVVNAVKDEIKQFEDDNDGMTITSTMDQGAPIEDSVHTMVNKALFGAIFAVVIILLFLRNIRSTIISIISIPLSILIGLILLYEMDISLNIMTLGAITVAIGRVIDDSIVVVENIYRRMSLADEKLRGKELIIDATREMFVPILSSTVVTVAVFLPLGLVEGQIGELFLPFALAVVFALLASLLVAVTVVPMVAHTLFRKRLDRGTSEEEAKSYVHKEEKPSKLANFYKRVLNWSLSHKIITFVIALALLIGSLFLVPSIGVSFIPSTGENMVVASYSPEPGQTREDIQEIADEAEDMLLDRNGVETLQYTISSGGNPLSGSTGDSALFYMEYADDYEDIQSETEAVVDDLQALSDQGEWGSIDMTGTSSNTTQYYIYGDSVEDIQTASQQVMDLIENDDNFTNVDSDASEQYDKYTIVANQEELAQLGLTAAQVTGQLSNIGSQPSIATIQNEDGDALDVYVQVANESFEDKEDLENTTIQTSLGTEVALNEIAEIEDGQSPNTLQRRDEKLYGSVSADITSDDIATATSGLQEEIENLDLPDGVSIDQGGVSEQINESFSQLGLAILAAIAIVYFVLVLTFGGALAPLAILFSLPFTVIGALVGLLIGGETISVSSLIGVLMLIGIVVTNAIVLVDRIIHKEKEGISTREAILEAGVTRLRPILMTAIATIGALAPLAFGFEGGGSVLISKGLGITVIGGLISSTLLTLVIVPIVYEATTRFSMQEHHKLERQRRKERKQAKKAAK